MIVVAVGIRETVKHFKGQGACCGGSTVKPQKKRLKNKVVRTYTFHVDRMHCQNCVNAVTRAINDIDGASATVSLRRKTAKVKCDREIDEQIRKFVTESRTINRGFFKIQHIEKHGKDG